MTRPHIICYMMTSVDGRIDCAMTAQVKGTDEYYQILRELDLPTTVSGRNTAQMEMGSTGIFHADDPAPYGKEGFRKTIDAPGYEVVVDTHGTLMWRRETSTEKPMLVITSESVPQAYLDYLDGQNISWIAAGRDRTDLTRASEILADEFGVTRMGVVGGPTINTAFLNAGLLDEVIVLVGPAIDGRAEMPSVFEGREDPTPLALHLTNVHAYKNGAVLLRYTL